MATLILHGGEKFKKMVSIDGKTGKKIIYVDDIDVIIHKNGKDSNILKLPNN